MDALPFTDIELQSIKSVFGNSQDTLIIVRKMLLQFELNEYEVGVIKSLDDTIKGVIKGMLMPEISGDSKVTHSNIDLWMTIQLEGHTPDIVFGARKLLIERVKEAVERLYNVEKIGQSIDFIYDAEKDVDDTHKEIVARNMFINHINQNMFRLHMISNEKTESEEQKKTRLTKNSAK